MNMSKLFLVAGFLMTSILFGQTNPIISGCITNAPDTLSNVKVAYLKGKGLAVKQEISVKNGCFEAAWEQAERGIFILYIDGEHTFDLVISSGNLTIEADYNDLSKVSLIGPGIEEFNGFKSLLSTKLVSKPLRDPICYS